MIAPAPVRIKHIGVSEIPLLHRLAQGGESPVRDGDLINLGGHNLKNTGLQDHFGIGLVNLGKLLFRPLEVANEIDLATPQAKASSDKLGTGAFEHSNVVIEVAPAVEQALHRNRSREIVVQDLPRDRPVKMISAVGEGLIPAVEAE